jgi:hypothetical protein
MLKTELITNRQNLSFYRNNPDITASGSIHFWTVIRIRTANRNHPQSDRSHSANLNATFYPLLSTSIHFYTLLYTSIHFYTLLNCRPNQNCQSESSTVGSEQFGQFERNIRLYFVARSATLWCLRQRPSVSYSRDPIPNRWNPTTPVPRLCYVSPG